MLSLKEVKEHAKTYLDQAFKILNKKKTEVRWNSEWLGEMSFMDIIKLGSKQTVARMMERQDFKDRVKAGADLSIYEFYYPLLQAYDSVALEADVELGGTDQKFNLLLGRQIQQRYGQEPQVILMVPLLLGTDGEKKMSKSYGNYIGISEPPKEIFGKVMSITDDLMWHYYELLTEEDIATLKKIHPKEAKINLAKILVSRFFSEKEADKAAQEFEKVFAQKAKPTDIEEKKLKRQGGEIGVVEMLVASGLVSSKGEARRLIEQNGVRVDDQRVGETDAAFKTDEPHLVQLGKRRFLKIDFE